MFWQPTYADATELTGNFLAVTIASDARERQTPKRTLRRLLKLRGAALQLGMSFPTIKQWINKNKILSNRTAGGHHRIPQSEVDRFLFRTHGNSARKKSGAWVVVIRSWDEMSPCR
jgi:excisionase family DNA binding protein